MSIRRGARAWVTRGLGPGVVLAALSGGLPAYAQVADLTKATCAQLMNLPRNDRGQLIVWLHGYYAGAAQRAMLDRTKLEETVSAIQQACERNRGVPLIGAEARAIFLGEPAPHPPPASPPAQPAPVTRPFRPR